MTLFILGVLSLVAGLLAVWAGSQVVEVAQSYRADTSDLTEILESSETRCIAPLASLVSPRESFRAKDAEFWAALPGQPTVVGRPSVATTHRALRLAALKASERPLLSAQPTVVGYHAPRKPTPRRAGAYSAPDFARSERAIRATRARIAKVQEPGYFLCSNHAPAPEYPRREGNHLGDTVVIRLPE